MYVEYVAIEQLVLVIVFYYLVFSLILVGGSMMFGGAAAASVVARFLFVRPVQTLLVAAVALLRWALGELWKFCRWLLAKAWQFMRWMGMKVWHVVLDFLFWPLARGLAVVLHLAAVGFADTVHFLFTGRGR